MQLTYNNQTPLAGGCFEEKDSGVSRFGKAVIEEMNNLGVYSGNVYKLKDGYVDDFIKAINDYDYSKALSMRLISTSDNEFISIMEYDEIEKTGDDEVDGVNWLDTVEHMLDFYGESRTDSCSGLVLAAHDQ